MGSVNGALLHGRTIPAGAFLLLGGGEQPGLDRRSALILGLGLGLGGRLLLFLPLLLGLAGLSLLRLGLLLFGRGGLTLGGFAALLALLLALALLLLRLLIAGGDGFSGGEEPPSIWRQSS